MSDNGPGRLAPIRRKMKPGARECVVYGLADPRTGVVRYIGSSGRGIKRAYEHAQRVKLDTNPEKRAWIEELAAAGLTYEVVTLEVCDSPYWAVTSEAQWIYRAKLMGVPLLNRQSIGFRKGQPAKRPQWLEKLTEEHGDVDRRIWGEER